MARRIFRSAIAFVLQASVALIVIFGLLLSLAVFAILALPWLMFGWLGALLYVPCAYLSPYDFPDPHEAKKALMSPRKALAFGMKGPLFFGEMLVVLHHCMMVRFEIFGPSDLDESEPKSLPEPTDTSTN